MLAEALLYVRARLGGQGNPYGHLAESVGIWARHRRQRQAWAPHLTRARALCIAAAEALPQERRRTALVLGAGLLLDVPLEPLSRLFRRVVLADLAFLPQTVRLAGRLGNVELLRVDLSGCMELLDAGPPDPVPQPDLSLGLPDLDFVYSANLASQLPLFALAKLRRRGPQRDPEQLERLAGAMCGAHFAALERLARGGCAVCLVTDTVEQGFAGSMLEYETDLLHGAAPACAGQTWTWDMAPRGEVDPRLDLRRQVLGVGNFAAAQPGGEHG